MTKKLSLVTIIIILGIGLFIYIKHSQKPSISAGWPQNEKDKYIQECLMGLDSTAIKYPDLAKEYCECSMETIMNSMNYEQYNDIFKRPEEEQLKILEPLIQNCLDRLIFKIDSIQRTQK